jgi:4-pyridoxate dehydrogenase
VEFGQFDYIIVGAGSAGCVLANRLSGDERVSVLLLEAGGPDRHPYIHIPLGIGKLHERRMFDWGYHSELEPMFKHRRIEAMRGRILGGSSSINVMAYTRGHPGDHDRWAQNGAIGWAFEDVLPYFRKSETWERGADDFRGDSGPLQITLAKARDPLFEHWMDAAREAGYPISSDFNGEIAVGFGRGRATIGAGRRSSTATAYLRPVRGRPNLNA